MAEKIRLQYETMGVQGYYLSNGATYHNPHEKQIHVLLEQFAEILHYSNVLDLACGSGEVSAKILELGGNVVGIDPYTAAAYQKRLGLTAEAISFDDIAKGALIARNYSLIICSFALHLADTSRLPLICYHLANISPKFLILTPHKRPVIKAEWGWQLETEMQFERVKARLYQSKYCEEKPKDK
jgi:SAM-dependent methyltransferase